MSIVGKMDAPFTDRESLGRSYANDPIKEYARTFLDSVRDVLNESHIDLYSEPRKAMMLESAENTLRNFFIENSDVEARWKTPEQQEEHIQEMNQLFDNDREAVLEYAPMNAYNPVIGMTFPIHKNLLMNCIFDKGAIPKAVAAKPKFTISMETRWLVTPEGEKIDMFKEQYKMFDAIESTAPIIEVVIPLPENESIDILKDYFHTNRIDDNLSIETYISAVGVLSYIDVGETRYSESGKKDVIQTVAGDGYAWYPVHEAFTPAYGEYDRTLVTKVNIPRRVKKDKATILAPIDVVLTGYTKENMFCISSTSPTNIVKYVKLACRIDTSTAMLRTCSAAWSVTTDIIEIPNAIPINTPISPEEVKDLQALYQVNQVTKIMSLFKTVLGNYKDDKIKRHLDDSFLHMPADSKISRTFDFAPRADYAFDHIEWRQKTFMDALDSYVTSLIQVLNDPNVTISVIGRADLVRKIAPTTQYDYVTSATIGPVELDFVKTVVTSDKRVYQFISSDKLRGNNNLIIILNPRNTDRIMYCIYDYQTYVSNEIRNAVNPSLPAIHAFERFKFVEYQPVQGRVKILNPTGLREWNPNDDPIGKSAMNDFDSDYPMGYNPETGKMTEAPVAPTSVTITNETLNVKTQDGE